MSKPVEVDDLIIGGGAPGLSLACAMQRVASDRTLMLIEPRDRYRRDRTWCYWQLAPGPSEPLVTHSWRSWRIAVDGREQLCHSTRYRYCHIPAQRYYNQALQQLTRSEHCRLQLGTTARRITESTSGANVITNKGTIHARRIFDSRPPLITTAARRASIELKKHFVGWHVHTHTPIFEPDVMTLMDFQRRKDGLIQFFYLLPFSRTQALVEVNYISPRTLPLACYEHDLRRYLRHLGENSGYKVLWSEQGCMRLSSQAPQLRPSSHVYAISATGGLVKSSSGAAFAAIRAFSGELAKRLAEDELPEPPGLRSRWLTTLDRLLLSVLAHHPERAPELFYNLFKQVEPDVVVRFLAERPQSGDLLAVLGAMPKKLLTGQALRSTSLWFT